MPSAAELGDVFDDPAHGEPGRDRITVHVVWELVLLVGVVALFVVLRWQHPDVMQGAALREGVLATTALGLVTFGAALSLRSAVPNLLVGPLAYGSGLLFAQHSGSGAMSAALFTGLIAAAAGAALAVLVVGFHVPAWAAGLGGLGVALYWLERYGPAPAIKVGYQPLSYAYYWFIGFAALSVIAGSIGVGKPLRRLAGRFRPVGDPARRRGVLAGVVATGSLIVSSLFASAGGVLFALLAGGATKRTIMQAGPESGAVRSGGPALSGSTLAMAALALTVLAVGAALLGGVSGFGRRGGIGGTALAVVLLTLLVRYAAQGGRELPELAVGAAAVLVGLVVTRLVETFGRPLSAVDRGDDDDPGSLDDVVPSGWGGPLPGGWTSTLPPLQDSEPRQRDESWQIDDRWGVR